MAGAAVRGWFHTEGRLGDRTLAQQLRGLGQLLNEVNGKTVLDVGCAEGLLSLEMNRRGAASVRGVEIISEHVKIATQLVECLGNTCTFEVADANSYIPDDTYNVVLMLGILHKLRDPTASCKRIAAWCTDLCVVRLPPETAPVIVDDRSCRRPHDIKAALDSIGMRLESVTFGTYGEWIGYFRRG